MTRVIKIGGRPQSDPSLATTLASGWSQTNGGLVLVHGGGDEVSTLQAALGGSTTFVNGRRVTTEKDIDLVRMALSGSANKRLVANLVQSGIDAVGLSGEDAALIAASPMDAERPRLRRRSEDGERRVSAASAVGRLPARDLAGESRRDGHARRRRSM